MRSFFIDFSLDFSRFWPFTDTSRITTTAAEPLYLKVFQAMCGSVAAKIQKLKSGFAWCNLFTTRHRDADVAGVSITSKQEFFPTYTFC